MLITLDVPNSTSTTTIQIVAPHRIVIQLQTETGAATYSYRSVYFLLLLAVLLWSKDVNTKHGACQRWCSSPSCCHDRHEWESRRQRTCKVRHLFWIWWFSITTLISYLIECATNSHAKNMQSQCPIGTHTDSLAIPSQWMGCGLSWANGPHDRWRGPAS